MLLEPRLSNKALAELCHRLAVETDAGIDIRSTWQREADSAPTRLRPYMDQVRDGIAHGKSMSLALAGTGHVFPPLFLEMARVGEEVGLARPCLSQSQIALPPLSQAQRIFLAAIAWPLLELAFAICRDRRLDLGSGHCRRPQQRPADRCPRLRPGWHQRPPHLHEFYRCRRPVHRGLVVAINRGVLWTRPIQRGCSACPLSDRPSKKSASPG